MEERSRSVSNVRKGSHFRIAVIAAAAALALGGLVRANVIRLPGQQSAPKAEKVSVKMAGRVEPVSLGQLKNGFSAAIDPALAAVVNISSTKVIKRTYQTPDFFNDPFFRQFFGNQLPYGGNQPQTQREHSLGSGVIINPNGYILTNNHVVSGASDIQVFTQEKKQYKAKVIGTDPRTDIAVLKIDATDLPTLTLGDSSQLKVGDIVFAIGDPLGVGETATMGIVSATGRSLGGAIEHYEDFIQTDAAINPGNSGGALVEMHGNLIGINTAIISRGGGNEGIGFAIPINMAKNVMDQILEHGKVIRGYLGVSIQQVSPDMAKAFGLARGGGALISDVTPDSPAAKAGLERGDVVLAMDGQAVSGPDDLSVRISQTAPGTVVHLNVSRDGKTRDIAVTLGEFPEQGAAAGPGGGGAAGAALQGVNVQNLTPAIARQLGVPPAVSGVVVSDVDPSSPAAAAGIQQGDVIMEVNRKPVHNVSQYQQAVSETGDKSVLLLVNRSGQTSYVVVQPQ
jgi:serine protease Do